jgi:hypothetical protein
MNHLRFCRLSVALAGAVLLTLSQWAGAEPPSRAARLGYISGSVIFSPAGEDTWLRARVNRPLTTGDRLWVEDNARAELQIGGAAIRLGGGTSLTLLNLDDRIVQLQLNEGSLRVRVHRLGPNQAFEVNTPNLAFTMRRAGEYRIDVDANDDATAVLVRSGRGEAYGERRSYALNAGQGFRFYGTGVSDYDRYASRDDDLDRWARERDRRYTTSASARYVSGDVVGYEDLDAHGSWRKDPTYGSVWAPSRVASGWTPYRDGHWAWIDPWGWTWVDDQPWGYAVSHYGRWANSQGRWVWVPGPRAQPAVYAPAQVAFVGGANPAAAAVGALAALVGWFPLAPREVYQPSYQVSRGYFERINRSNAAIAPTTITNIYNTTIVNKTVHKTVYVNQRVQGAVVAVPPQAFTQAQPVAQAAVPVSQQTAAAAPAAPSATVKPDRQSVRGGAQAADSRPRNRERRVVARTAPPAAATPAASATVAPAAAAPPPAAVTTVQAPAPTAPPPAVAPAPRSPDERRADAAKRDGGRGEARGEGRKGDRDSAKADAAKGEAPKAEAAKADAAKSAAAKADAAKADAAKAAAAADAAKADAAKSAAAKADAAKAEAAKAEAARADAAKADAAKGAERKRDRDKADAAKNEDRKNEERRRDRDKADAGKADAARAEAAAKADAAKAEAAKAEASRAAQVKGAADKAAADRAAADAARAAQAKAAADKAAADKAAADAAKAAQAEAAKAAAAQAAAAKAAAKAEAKAERQEERAARKADDDKKVAN